MEENNVGKKETGKTSGEAVSCDDRIAFIDSLQQVRQESPIKLDAFLMVVCLRGRGTMNINGRTFEIGPNNLVVCHPNVVLDRGMADSDTDFRCICLSRTYLQQLSMVGDGYTWDVVLFLEQSPVLALTADEVHDFCQYYDLMRSKVTETSRHHRKEILDALLIAFLYEFRDVLERFVELKPVPYTAVNNVFRNFLTLLASTYPKPRSVSWYADRLCLTPKYLSTVCKEASGETASELINHYVVKDIDLLLRKRGKSIKEICNELEFPNLSFFGRYVKKHLGLSPKLYRERVLGNGNW